ncbi:hypothetical protein LQR31_02750 [Chromobacterium vaccinii]|uniref:hypothetical protein n=1 Tax=Chromobacterium vaccinii TaxID=1108595 RepID=UPI001E418069|nr:hypothetical protein [Chromobacterium vaccinii]MCD4483390.1 hypothetical protein [Chromobacterium vaccinii]
MKKEFIIPLLSALLGGVLSCIAVYIQTNMATKERTNDLKRQKLETILETAYKLDICTRREIGSGSQTDECDNDYSPSKITTLTQIYFPKMTDASQDFVLNTLKMRTELHKCPNRNGDAKTIEKSIKCIDTIIEKRAKQKLLHNLYIQAITEANSLR